MRPHPRHHHHWRPRTPDRIALVICTAPGNLHNGSLDQHSAIALVRRILDHELARRDGRSNDLTGLITNHWPRLTAATFHDVLQITEACGYRVLIPGDDHWPAALADLGDTQPVVLWVTGDSALLAAPPEQNIAITGSRACTAYGERTASELAHDLAKYGYIVVSGGAYGIEGSAHRAALAADARTVAVLAAGLDRPHPRNADLVRRIAESGALLSEAPPGATPSRTQFVQRGRIIAGLCTTTVVVEANTRSGALAVAHRALALSRTVAAVPGPVTSVTSTGCHRLIQDGETRLVTDAEDILAALISLPPS